MIGRMSPHGKGHRPASPVIFPSCETTAHPPVDRRYGSKIDPYAHLGGRVAGVRPADASQAAAHRAQDPRPPAVRDGLRRGVLHDPTVREAVEAGQPGAFGRILRTGWIGNGVLDGSLEDESLFGEFFRTPVSEGGVEPLVIGPPHAVVGAAPRLLDRGVVVPVHELLLQQPVRRRGHRQDRSPDARAGRSRRTRGPAGSRASPR